MIRIAVCDNDVVFCHVVMSMLEHILYGKKYEIEEFANGRELLEEMEKTEEGCIYQLIILEVDLPFYDGIFVGQQLRRNTVYRDVMLVYLSAYDCAAERITDLHPFAYIRKNIAAPALQRKLETCIGALRKPVRYVAKGKVCRVVLEPEEILYLESVNRSTIVHCDNRACVELALPLKQVFRELMELDGYFLQPHKSFVVNSRRITGFSRTEVQLGDRIWVPASHSYHQKFMEAYLELFETNFSQNKIDNF